MVQMKIVWLLVLWLFPGALMPRDISVNDFYRLGEEHPGVVIFDVRPAVEFQESRIPNALFAGRKDLLLKHLSYLSDTTLILVYCENGDRSKTVLKILKKEGFKNTGHLKRGFEAWQQEGFPVDTTPMATDDGCP